MGSFVKYLGGSRLYYWISQVTIPLTVRLLSLKQLPLEQIIYYFIDVRDKQSCQKKLDFNAVTNFLFGMAMAGCVTASKRALHIIFLVQPPHQREREGECHLTHRR